MGSSKLAANLFRITQTEERLIKDQIDNEKDANNVHYEVGRKIRKAIDKYRFKFEVKNFYNFPNGQDVIGGTYETLNTIKDMIMQFA